MNVTVGVETPAKRPHSREPKMDLNWIFYAVVMFIAGGTCFFTAIAALVKLDQVEPQMATEPLITKEAPPEPGPKLTRLGRPVQEIRLV